MQRLFAIAVLGAAAILPPHLGAQFRGFAGGGGFAARGMVAPGFHGGFRTAGPAFHSGFRAAPVAPFGFHSGFHTVAPFGVAPFHTHGFVFVGSFGHNPHFHVFVGTPCVNCGFVHRGFYPAYAGYAYPGYYPGYYPPDYTQSAYASQPPVIVQNAPPGYGDNQQLVEEVQGLRDEVRQMREEQGAARQPAAERNNAPADGPTIVLVFRDGHRSEIRNYAISGKTLWVFNERQAKKILISELDIPATEAANNERGVEFSIPQ
jgi:hypothetical protein